MGRTHSRVLVCNTTRAVFVPVSPSALTLNLLEETKSDPCQVADVVLAYTTLLGLSPGYWAHLVNKYPPERPTALFSTSDTPVWDSRHFREVYAWPLLEEMRAQGEPSLQIFSADKGGRIQDKVYSIHSWRRAGRSRTSRPARHK
jgi:hypothetical protein